MNAVVIIPVYQPEKCLENLVEKLWEAENQIIVVDDGSDEKFQNVFWKLSEKAIVLHHGKNKGKGVAIKTALEYIRKDLWQYDVIGVMDGDGQHQVSDMEKLIFKARKYRDSLVLGVRSFRNKIPLRSMIGNTVTKKVFRVITGVAVSDTQSGLRAFSKDLIDFFLNISGKRYEYETQVLMTCAKKRIPIKEVEIETIYHDKGNTCSHFHAIRDSIRIYKELLKFVSISFSSFVLDYLLFCMLFLGSGKQIALLGVINVTARIVSGTYNYLLNTKLVFEESVNIKSAGKYVVLAVSIIVLNNMILTQYIHVIPSPQIAKILTECSLFVISFVVQKFIIFGKNRDKIRVREVAIR